MTDQALPAGLTLSQLLVLLSDRGLPPGQAHLALSLQLLNAQDSTKSAAAGGVRCGTELRRNRSNGTGPDFASLLIS